MLKFTFKPRLIPGIAVAAGITLFVNLGHWQAGKAERRSAEIAQHKARGQHAAYRLTAATVSAEDVQDVPVTVRGVYEPAHQFYVDNRLQDGRPGVHIVTPLKIEGSDTRVLINRGWAEWSVRQSPLPVAETPVGVVEINGIASIPTTKKFFLMPEHEDNNGALWTRLDLARFAKTVPGTLQPVVVLQNQTDSKDALVRKWPPPEDRVSMHQSYSMQWFGMAGALLVFYLVASLRKKETE